MRKTIIAGALLCLLGTTSFLFAGLQSPGNVVTITQTGNYKIISGVMTHSVASPNTTEYIGCAMNHSPGSEQARCYARDANGNSVAGFTLDAGMQELIRTIGPSTRMLIAIDMSTNEIYSITINKRSELL